MTVSRTADRATDDSRRGVPETIADVYGALNHAVFTRGSIRNAKGSIRERGTIPGLDGAIADHVETSEIVEVVLNTGFTSTITDATTAQLVPERIVDTDRTVLVEGAYIGVSTDGVAFDRSFAHVFHVEGGAIHAVSGYVDTKPAREGLDGEVTVEHVTDDLDSTLTRE